MVDRVRGVIVNVASMAGKPPLKGCTYYGATKAGLGMASEIARAELAPHGVRVVTVYPGPVRSALEQTARADYGGGGDAAASRRSASRPSWRAGSCSRSRAPSRASSTRAPTSSAGSRPPWRAESR